MVPQQTTTNIAKIYPVIIIKQNDLYVLNDFIYQVMVGMIIIIPFSLYSLFTYNFNKNNKKWPKTKINTHTEGEGKKRTFKFVNVTKKGIWRQRTSEKKSVVYNVKMFIFLLQLFFIAASMYFVWALSKVYDRR